VVLDVKAMEWASENGIDTATLKKAKIPIYGKWYFPELPGDVPVINLKNGHIEVFEPGMRAGEVLYVKREDLLRARLGPYATWPERQAAAEAEASEVETPVAVEEPAPAHPPSEEPAPPPGLHMPSPSIFPLVLALGVSITLLGLVAGPWPVRVIVVVLGLIYAIVGGAGWAVESVRDRDAAEAHELEPAVVE
jgi:hypothetical protein